MADYDFKCIGCGTQFTISSSFSTIATCEKICPKCKGHNVRRVYNPKAFVMKGKSKDPNASEDIWK